jgi:protein-S-isoprenylcysteine O-methyltransferase Ste14
MHAWFFPQHSLGETRLDLLGNIGGMASLALGGLLRIWAVSHAGRHTRSRTLKAPLLITAGPYGIVRNPIYLGNFLIGLGLVVLAEAIPWLPFYFILFGWSYREIVVREESFLRNQFGLEFECYCKAVPRWLARLDRLSRALSLGSNFHARELGTTCGILCAVFFFEWIKSPVHRVWVVSLFRWLSS